MEKFGIPQPCNEDFSKMTFTERGAFCSKCSTDTFNFTTKSHAEIKSILSDHIGQEICGRILPSQIEAINAEFETWSFRSTKSFQSAFVFSLIAVFGLTLFSCQDKRHEIEVDNFQKATTEIVNAVQNQISLEDAVGTTKKLFAFQPVPIFPFNFDWQCMNWNYPLGGQIYLPDYYGQYLNQPLPFGTPIIVDSVVQVDSTLVDSTNDIPPTIAVPDYELMVFPNPTSGIMTLEVKNLEKARYQIDLYDLNGKHYKDIYSGKIDEDLFRQEFDMSDLPTGEYLVTITAKKFKETIRVSKI